MPLVTRPLRVLLGLCVVLSGLVLVGVPSAATAADNGAWSVTPTPPATATPTPRDYFVLDGKPGDLLRDKVRVRNYTNKPLTFRLYGADGYNTEQGGFFALKGNEEPQLDVGGWVTIPVQNLTVLAKTQVDVPFTIKIPDNATPGDHVGGVVALNTAIEGSQDAGGFEVGVQRAVGARLYVRVAGPTTPGLEVSDVALETDRGALPWAGSGKGTVTYTVENIGNLRLSPQTQVRLTGLFGRELHTVSSPGLVDLLPGQRAVLTQEVEGIGPADRVTSAVTVSTPEGASSTADHARWLVPWPGALLVVLLVAAGGFLWYRRRTAVRRGLGAAQSSPRLMVPADQ